MEMERETETETERERETERDRETERELRCVSTSMQGQTDLWVFHGARGKVRHRLEPLRLEPLAEPRSILLSDVS